MKTILIGCGNIAHAHMRYLRKLNIEVSAICDLSEVRIKEFADQYRISSTYTSVDEALEKENPDIVHLLTPPQTHFALIDKLLDCGCNVFVEKPVCQTLEDFELLSQKAQKLNLLIGVDHTRVFSPMIVKARRLIESGRFGQIVRMEYDYDDPSLIVDENFTTGYKWARGVPGWFSALRGGLLADLLPHPLSVMSSFVDDLQHVHTETNWTTDGKIPKNITSTLSSEKVHALIKLSLESKPLRNILLIYCERGSIRIDLRNMHIVILPQRNMPNIVARVVNTASEVWQQSLGFVFSVVGILSGRKNPYDGLDELISRFRKQATENEFVEIPLTCVERVMILTEEILSTAAPDWCKDGEPLGNGFEGQILSPADILVVGGTGFVGRSLVGKLLEEKKKVRVLCRSKEGVLNLPDNVSIAFGDVKDKKSLERAFEGISQVYYCAAAMSGDWAEFYESTVGGTKNLLETLTYGNVKKLIYVSSLGIIDYNQLLNGDSLDENSTLEQFPEKRGHYTKSKKEAEDLVRNYAATNEKVNTVIIRPGLVYGKESNYNLQNSGVLIGKFLFVFGLGGRYLGLSYVENLASSMIALASKEEPSGTVYHAVEKEQPKVREIIKYHNQYSADKVVPLYIPIFVWKITFFFADRLLTLIKKRKSTLSYKFCSNSKRLNYDWSKLDKTVSLTKLTPIKETFREIY